MQEYTRHSLETKIDIGTEVSATAWSELYEKIASAEDRVHGRERGPSAIFKKLVLKIGNHKEVIDPWVGLIPNEYGLSVVKSAIAIILSVSNRESQLEGLVSQTDMAWLCCSSHNGKPKKGNKSSV